MGIKREDSTPPGRPAGKHGDAVHFAVFQHGFGLVTRLPDARAGGGAHRRAGRAQYAHQLFQILIDFGFIYSATAKVSRFREDKNVLNKVLTCVILAKALFMALSFLILFVFIAPSCRT